MIDEEDETKKAVAKIELLAAYVNPEAMRTILANREVQTPSEPVSRTINLRGIQITQTNPEFEVRMREVTETGQLEPKADNPDIPAIRQAVEQRTGKPLPSIRAMMGEADRILPDGT